MNGRSHVWVSGRVQGVWYRQSCASLAEELHVSGWVRNLPDGRVEGVFEGTIESLDRMVAWCRNGPPRAVVKAVEEVVEKPQGCEGFQVLP